MASEVKRYYATELLEEEHRPPEHSAAGMAVVVLASDFDALQKYHEDYKASMLESFAEINAIKEEALKRAERAERELAKEKRDHEGTRDILAAVRREWEETK